MPIIQAFAGLRYDLGHVGSLSDVVAPPYDVIDDELRDALYERHPANVIRLILNREEPGDDDRQNKYSRAARFLKNWRSEGVLQRDSNPALYVYHQAFEADGRPHIRRGFMCRVRLERFGEGSIFPHEETHASAKEDRLRLTRACQANLSQIFGLFPDPENQVQDELERHVANMTPIVATDHLGVVHRLWPVDDVDLITRVSSLMQTKPMFIADGHHRYETACNYRDELREAKGLDDNHPANFVLTMCVGMSDPGMIVLPTHRLFHGIPSMTAAQLKQSLGDCFECHAAGKGPEDAQYVWSEIERENEQATIGLYTVEDGSWTIARITPTGRGRMKQVAHEHSADWQGLGVSILHRLIIQDLLGINDAPKPTYLHLVDEVVRDLNASSKNPPQLAALVMPATLDHIRAISEHGERMPAKSTYFYPKLLSGLVINGLE